MNQSSQEHALSLGPCADYEFDLFEHGEGALAPGPAARLQQHLARCARCRAHAAALAGLDTSLASLLPRPALSPAFDARLAARIAGLRGAPGRASALAAAEREHQRLLGALGRGVGWRTWLNAAALASVAGSVVLALDAVAPQLLQAHGLVPAGFSASATFGAVLGIAVLAGGLVVGRQLGGGLSLRRG
jgi:anti-sigma factor RsiW